MCFGYGYKVSILPYSLILYWHLHHMHCICPHPLISPAGIDYEAVNTTLTFNGFMPAQVVNIPILDDQSVENDKSFRVTLTTIDTATTLCLQTASVTIRDTNSKLHRTSKYIL